MDERFVNPDIYVGEFSEHYINEELQIRYMTLDQLEAESILDAKYCDALRRQSQRTNEKDKVLE